MDEHYSMFQGQGSANLRSWSNHCRLSHVQRRGGEELSMSRRHGSRGPVCTEEIFEANFYIRSK